MSRGLKKMKCSSVNDMTACQMTLSSKIVLVQQEPTVDAKFISVLIHDNLSARQFLELQLYNFAE